MTKSVVQRMEITAQSAGDVIRVFLRDCRVDLSIGIYQAEMQKTQPVIVSVELEAALPHRYQDRVESRLDRVIDYEQIYNFIQQELPRMGHVYLLETLAEQVIEYCFRDIRVRKARVRLEKIEVFSSAAGAGIEITRNRPAEGASPS